MAPDYDVLIVGGGMVGASLACALAGQPLRVGLVEALPFEAQSHAAYDDRTLALAYGTRRIFEGIGLWEAVADEVTAIEKIHVSDRGHFGVTRLNAADEGVEALGYVAEMRVMGRALGERLEEVGAQVMCPATVGELQIDADAVRLTMRVDGRVRALSARLVVAADGTQSTIRDLLGIATVQWDYGQTAVIANVTPAYPHNNVAYERFTDSGPLALLPMSEGRCAMVWTVRSDKVDDVLELNDRAFLRRLQDRFGYRLGRFQRVGKRNAYPLSLVRAKEHVRPRVALIGNAAHTLHPVAGQGFNLGLRDVAALAEVLVDAVRGCVDPGETGVLARYAEWRRRDQQKAIAFTDGLARIFSNPLPPVAAARNLGLIALDLFPPMKRLLTRQTMGLAGRVSRLGRGLPL